MSSSNDMHAAAAKEQGSDVPVAAGSKPKIVISKEQFPTANPILAGILAIIKAEQKATAESKTPSQTPDMKRRRATMFDDTRSQRESMEEFSRPILDEQAGVNEAIVKRQKQEAYCREHLQSTSYKAQLAVQLALPARQREDWDESTQTNTGKIAGKWYTYPEKKK